MNDELKPGENHPAAHEAFLFLRNLSIQDVALWMETFSSCAIEGNRMAEICAGTLTRFLKGQPLGERYLMGLVWMMKQMRPKPKKRTRKKKNEN